MCASLTCASLTLSFLKNLRSRLLSHTKSRILPGKLHLHHSLENAFGLGIGITRIKNVPSLSLIVATGSGKQWGVFHDTSMKKLFVVYQEEVVTAFEIIGMFMLCSYASNVVFVFD